MWVGQAFRMGGEPLRATSCHKVERAGGDSCPSARDTRRSSSRLSCGLVRRVCQKHFPQSLDPHVKAEMGLSVRVEIIA